METLQVASELESMLELYREQRPARLLEIGCWDGGTLKVWLENAAPNATIVAVDLEHRNAAAYEEWRRPDTTLHLYTGSSQDRVQIEAMQTHSPYDWVFVDGDHGDYGVRTDVDTCLPLVASGGLLLLHDITPPEGMDSYPPGDVLAELGQTYSTWTYQDLAPAPWARGIGVVQL